MDITIEKSNNDNREYIYTVLDNKLQCLIIKNENESMCGACLNIEIGSIFEKIDGLAHFLEHMVFMGSKKYPESHDFMGSINKSGGETNASTSNTYTNYYFTINSENFLETLDKFSHFFIDPLLNEEYIHKEINAVNSESLKNILDDVWIGQEILRTLVKPNHPINHYTCGTKESLTRDDIYKSLKDFHTKYYLAQYMSLVIFTNKNINMTNLINQITETFGKIKFTNDKVNKKYGNIINSNEVVYYVPNKNENKLTIVLEFPHVSELLKSPYWFIKQILSTEYTDSIYSYLLKNNYIVATEISDLINLDDFDIITIEYILTDNGLNKIDFVYTYVILYLDFLLEKIINKDAYLNKIYDEYIQSSKNNFIYWENSDIISSITFLSHIMQENVNKEYLLSFDTHIINFEEFSKQVTKNYNFSVAIGSKKYEDKYNNKFPIYNTHYNLEKLKLKKIDNLVFTLPVLNDYICYNLKFNNKISQSVIPTNIKENDKYKLFYYADKKFNIPLVDFKIIMNVPSVLSDINIYVSSILYLNSAYNYINSLKNMAYDANYLINVRLDLDLLYIYISGYTEKIDRIIKLINKMFNDDFDSSYFEIAHTELIKSLKNTKVSSPISQMFILFDKTIYNNFFDPELQIETAKKIKFKDCIKTFRDNFIINKTNILCCGNIDKEDVLILTDKLYNYINSKQSNNNNNIIDSLNNYITLYKKIIKSSNKDETNSVMTLNYNLFNIKKISGNNWKSKILFARLCNAVLNYKYFHSLRTEKQLGYIVKCKIVNIINNYNIITILQFLVQSPNTKSEKLFELTEEFINNESEYIMNKMTDNEFKSYINGERAKLEKKFITLSSLGSYFTSALLDESYIFDINDNLLNKLDTFNLHKFKKYYKKYIINNNNVFMLGIDGN